MAERAANHRMFFGNHSSGDICGRFFNEANGLVVRGEQRFNFAAQFFVARAGF